MDHVHARAASAAQQFAPNQIHRQWPTKWLCVPIAAWATTTVRCTSSAKEKDCPCAHATPERCRHRVQLCRARPRGHLLDPKDRPMWPGNEVIAVCTPAIDTLAGKAWAERCGSSSIPRWRSSKFAADASNQRVLYPAIYEVRRGLSPRLHAGVFALSQPPRAHCEPPRVRALISASQRE